MTRNRGSILLYVVWAIMLLSLFAASISSRALFSIGLTERFSEQLRAGYIARAALHTGLLALEKDPSKGVDGLTDVWAGDAELFSGYGLPGGRFRVVADDETGLGPPRYGLTDEERRLNLNTAPQAMLQRLFETEAAMTEPEAIEIAAAIQDWRDADDDESPFGAEGRYYRSRQDGYDAKDGPFENLEELLLVRGVTPAVYRRVEPFLTVYGAGHVNLNTASQPVLRALGLSERGLSGVLNFRVGEDGLAETDDDRRLVTVNALDSDLALFVPLEDIGRLTDLAEDRLVGVGSTRFRIVAHAETSHKAGRMRVTCVMDRKGEIELWTEQ